MSITGIYHISDATELGLHCLPLIQQFWTHQQVVKWTCLNLIIA